MVAWTYFCSCQVSGSISHCQNRGGVIYLPNIAKYYKKRFCRILPEYWLFLLVLFFIQIDFGLRSVCTLLFDATTIGYWIPEAPYKLWYMSCIVVFYAIFPIYFKLFKKHGLKVSIGFIVGGFLLALFYLVIMAFCFDNENYGELLSRSISRVPIFFIGALVGHYAKDSKEFVMTNKGKVVNLILFMLSMAAVFYLQNIWSHALRYLPFMFITPTLCMILAWLFDKLPHTVSSIFTKIGSISLELYMCHVAVYYDMGLRYAITNSWGAYVGIPMVFALSFLAAIILYYINKHVLQPVCGRMLKL